jgi:hypothetical protein
MKFATVLAIALLEYCQCSYGEDLKYPELENVSYYNIVGDTISETDSQSCLNYTQEMRRTMELSLSQRKLHTCSSANAPVTNAILCDNYDDVLGYGIFDEREKAVYLYRVLNYQVLGGVKTTTIHPDKKVFLYSLLFSLDSDKGTLSLSVVDRSHLYIDRRTERGSITHGGHITAKFPEYPNGYFFAPYFLSIKKDCELKVSVDIKFERRKAISAPSAGPAPALDRESVTPAPR